MPYLQSAKIKFGNLSSFIRLRCKIKNVNNISLIFIIVTYNNQIFRNCFVFIYCHLTKVSSQIDKCIIFEPNELSIILSTLWSLSERETFNMAKVRWGNIIEWSTITSISSISKLFKIKAYLTVIILICGLSLCKKKLYNTKSVFIN